MALSLTTKQEILDEYLLWVDKVSEDIEDKSYFSTEEVLNKLIEIMERKQLIFEG